VDRDAKSRGLKDVSQRRGAPTSQNLAYTYSDRIEELRQIMDQNYYEYLRCCRNIQNLY